MQEAIIIGGGIAGLSAAIALQKVGIECKVYEKAPEIRAVGAGIVMASNALQVFGNLGLAENIINAGAALAEFTISNEKFQPIQNMSQNWIREKYGFGNIAIHRADLQKVLIEALGKEHLLLGKDFDYFEQAEKKVTAFFKDGSMVAGKFLLGADGIHSAVRHQLFPNIPYRYTNQTCWRGITNIPVPDFLQNKAIEAWGNQRRFGIVPVNKEKIYWFAVLTEKPGGKDEPSRLKEHLKEIFSSFHPYVKELIGETPLDQIIRNDLYDFKPIKKWHNGRVSLIGDAAHATTPNMGQGGCQAVEDAWALFNIFSQTKIPEIAFERFRKKRFAKTSKITNQSFFLGEMAHWKYGRSIRNAFLKLMPEQMGRKQTEWVLNID